VPLTAIAERTSLFILLAIESGINMQQTGARSWNKKNN
jgi:hypothetical protein